MIRTTDFIADLIRAANEVEKLGAPEKRRLLLRAMRRTIYDLCAWRGWCRAQCLRTLLTVSGRLKTSNHVLLAPLLAINVISTLKFVADAKDEIIKEQPRCKKTVH
ncbi:hypothetical protein QO002_000103 [Pararhizobium capsulatum DSM 1112]|uniref:Uncharacterized protein n=1 Tax=Pararhizobium capsulatum DSM 1112 TaxID=1121113 RepID=A0ABU0BI87_9HYPH|nr:hypothetical protein [Pararhizobium capsulatum DSM 1112]